MSKVKPSLEDLYSALSEIDPMADSQSADKVNGLSLFLQLNSQEFRLDFDAQRQLFSDPASRRRLHLLKERSQFGEMATDRLDSRTYTFPVLAAASADEDAVFVREFESVRLVLSEAKGSAGEFYLVVTINDEDFSGAEIWLFAQNEISIEKAVVKGIDDDGKAQLLMSVTSEPDKRFLAIFKDPAAQIEVRFVKDEPL